VKPLREAVSAIDAGDLAKLERLVAANPALVRDRLELPGAWLRDMIGRALDGFLQRQALCRTRTAIGLR